MSHLSCLASQYNRDDTYYPSGSFLFFLLFLFTFGSHFSIMNCHSHSNTNALPLSKSAKYRNQAFTTEVVVTRKNALGKFHARIPHSPYKKKYFKYIYFFSCFLPSLIKAMFDFLIILFGGWG